jgi:hypothetical protein
VYEWLLTTACQQSVEAILLAGDLLGHLDPYETSEDAQRHESHILTGMLETARRAAPRRQAGTLVAMVTRNACHVS